MARQTKPLTDVDCRNAKPNPDGSDRRLYDGSGLHLLVKASGAKQWRLKYTKPSGKSGMMSFGAYPTISLAAARKKREEVRAMLASGKDPQAEKGAAKIAAQYAAANTFELVALEWHAKELKNNGWSSDHADRVLKRLKDNVFPVIGKLPIEKLSTRDLLHPLQLVSKRDALDMAKRLRQYITAVMRYAVQTGRIQKNPAADLQGAIPTRSAKHQPALPLPRLPELLQRINSYGGRHIVKMAAHFGLLTGARSSEFRFARWAEFDLVNGVWTIPPERSELNGVRHSQRGEKMGRERVVYLARQTVALLSKIHELTGHGELVFEGQKRGYPISENVVNLLLRDVGYDTREDICLHGFRTMMVSSLNESGQFNPEAIERHIGHEGRSGAGAVRAIYNRNAQYLKERQRMLQWWADYLHSMKSGGYTEPSEFSVACNVVTLTSRKLA